MSDLLEFMLFGLIFFSVFVISVFLFSSIISNSPEFILPKDYCSEYTRIDKFIYYCMDTNNFFVCNNNKCSNVDNVYFGSELNE